MAPKKTMGERNFIKEGFLEETAKLPITSFVSLAWVVVFLHVLTLSPHPLHPAGRCFAAAEDTTAHLEEQSMSILSLERVRSRAKLYC